MLITGEKYLMYVLTFNATFFSEFYRISSYFDLINMKYIPKNLYLHKCLLEHHFTQYLSDT